MTRETKEDAEGASAVKKKKSRENLARVLAGTNLGKGNDDEDNGNAKTKIDLGAKTREKMQKDGESSGGGSKGNALALSKRDNFRRKKSGSRDDLFKRTGSRSGSRLDISGAAKQRSRTSGSRLGLGRTKSGSKLFADIRTKSGDALDPDNWEAPDTPKKRVSAVDKRRSFALTGGGAIHDGPGVDLDASILDTSGKDAIEVSKKIRSGSRSQLDLSLVSARSRDRLSASFDNLDEVDRKQRSRQLKKQSSRDKLDGSTDREPGLDKDEKLAQNKKRVTKNVSKKASKTSKKSSKTKSEREDQDSLLSVSKPRGFIVKENHEYAEDMGRGADENSTKRCRKTVNPDGLGGEVQF